MPMTPGVRCPMCGHVTPKPRGRDFITCTCGLRLVNQTTRASGHARAQTLFACLAIISMLTAAADLVRRLR